MKRTGKGLPRGGSDIVHPVEGGFVISRINCGWLPGSYDTERAAEYAFSFNDEALTEMQEEVNPGGHL